MLCVSHVTKMYTPTLGLRCADFTAEGGDTLALIGPNGSGKSTLIKILCDVHRADNGTCTLNHCMIQQCKSDIGFLPETPYLITGLTAIQFLRYVAGMKKMDSFASANEYLKLFQADSYAARKIYSLSQGQQKRIALIAAIMSNPYLLVLDEPTNGLDTMTLLLLKKLLLERRTNHQITILSSHILDFVENVATKVIFIKNGFTMPPHDISQNLEEDYIKTFLCAADISQNFQ
ncbi:MAG: ABC transporter ATP-binding protein [Clostridia bacterium]